MVILTGIPTVHALPARTGSVGALGMIVGGGVVDGGTVGEGEVIGGGGVGGATTVTGHASDRAATVNEAMFPCDKQFPD